jgi:hypothetical protein
VGPKAWLGLRGLRGRWADLRCVTLCVAGGGRQYTGDPRVLHVKDGNLVIQVRGGCDDDDDDCQGDVMEDACLVPRLMCGAGS